jgi:hypothetical protein
MSRGLCALSVVCTALFAGSAFAQGTGQGTAAEQEACTPDVLRLCGNFIPNVDPIVACLRANERQLSPDCHQVMFPPPPVADNPAPQKKTKRKTKPSSDR